MTAAVPKAPPSVRTPCVQVCTVDAESGLCLGCFRTLEEIATWIRLGEARRDEIMAELPERRSRVAPEKLGGA